MRKLILGKTKTPVSAIGLGTWSFGGANMVGKHPVGWAGQKDGDSEEVLINAWGNGINHWDTADVYGEGKSETIIGKMWDRVPRKEIFLATKVGWDRGPYSYWYEPKHMLNNLERSLNNLKTDCIDLVYLHHCNFGKDDEHFEGALETIKDFQNKGKTRFIGLSDWSSSRILKYIERCDPAVIQPYRNVMDDDYLTSGLKSYVDKNDIGVCFFSPIKHGLLTGKYNVPTSFEQGDHRSGIQEFADREVIDKMKHNKAMLKERFDRHPYPEMRGVVDSLFNDCPTGCVLLGQRNKKQVEIASTLGELMTDQDSDWVKSLYRNEG